MKKLSFLNIVVCFHRLMYCYHLISYPMLNHTLSFSSFFLFFSVFLFLTFSSVMESVLSTPMIEVLRSVSIDCRNSLSSSSVISVITFFAQNLKVVFSCSLNCSILSFDFPEDQYVVKIFRTPSKSLLYFCASAILCC